MTKPKAYETDLAYIHDQGYGDFARDSAPGLFNLMRQNDNQNGKVVDLGCGSGIWANCLSEAGYEIVGMDISPAMIEIARSRVPTAEFHVGSFLQFPIPSCRAVTALGEVFNYLFDPDNSVKSLQIVCRKIFDALSSGGILIFDVAEPSRYRGQKQAFTEGEGWVCLVEYQHDESTQQLTRRIVTFRQVGDAYRRQEEVHRQQLFEEGTISENLEAIGFGVQSMRSYGDYPLGQGVTGFVARKP